MLKLVICEFSKLKRKKIYMAGCSVRVFISRAADGIDDNAADSDAI